MTWAFSYSGYAAVKNTILPTVYQHNTIEKQQRVIAFKKDHVLSWFNSLEIQKATTTQIQM